MVSSLLPTGFTFSQASLQDYSDCPRRFQLKYIEKLNWPAPGLEPALEIERKQQEGQLFHRLIQQHLLGIPVDLLARQANSLDLNRWWENYLNHSPLTEHWSLYPEISLSCRLGAEHRLAAKMDLVAIDPQQSEVRIFDWKTYAKRPADARMAARWQTRLYRMLVVKTGAFLLHCDDLQPEQVSLHYWYAEHPAQPARFPYSRRQYDLDQAAILHLVQEICQAVDFPRTDEVRLCATCAFRTFCDRPAGAASGDYLESELEEPQINFEQVQEIRF